MSQCRLLQIQLNPYFYSKQIHLKFLITVLCGRRWTVYYLSPLLSPPLDSDSRTIHAANLRRYLCEHAKILPSHVKAAVIRLRPQRMRLTMMNSIIICTLSLWFYWLFLKINFISNKCFQKEINLQKKLFLSLPQIITFILFNLLTEKPSHSII